jgi:hypothetical protein
MISVIDRKWRQSRDFRSCDFRDVISADVTSGSTPFPNYDGIQVLSQVLIKALICHDHHHHRRWQKDIHCHSNRKFTKKYRKNEQLMNKMIKDLWKYNKNAKKKKIIIIILALDPKFHSWTFGCITFTKIKKKLKFAIIKHKRKLNFLSYSSKHTF